VPKSIRTHCGHLFSDKDCVPARKEGTRKTGGYMEEEGGSWNTKAPGFPHPSDDRGAQWPREGGGGTRDALGCSKSP